MSKHLERERWIEHGLAFHTMLIDHLSHAGRRRSVQIWMPRSTPVIKLSPARAYGADMVLYGGTSDKGGEA